MLLNSKIYFKLIQRFPQLSVFFKLNNGFLPEEKEDERDYVFGASDCQKTVLQKDGQWLAYLPEGELQSDGTESMSCVSQSLLNVIEIFIMQKFKEYKDYSDRFLAKVSGTTRNGNSMSRVIESLRKHYGVVKEDMWEEDYSSWNNYYANIPVNILAMGKLWLKEYELKYERVPDLKQSMMKALEYSPLWTSGFAWYKKGDLYYSYGSPNHAFVIVGYVEGSHWLAFDSYAPFIKKLDWNFKFSGTKMIMLGKKSLKYNANKINDLRKKGYTHILRAEGNGEVYRLDEGKLTKVDPKELMKDSVRVLADYKKLVGVTEDLYNSLII